MEGLDEALLVSLDVSEVNGEKELTYVTDAEFETIDGVKVGERDEVPVLLEEAVAQAEAVTEEVKVRTGLLIVGEIEG